MGCGTLSSSTLKSLLLMLLMGRLFRSMTRTCSVTSSVLIVSRSPSVISAEFGSGGGVGFGFRIGAGGGAPSWGAMRRPGAVCSTGVAVGWGGGVAAGAPVWRGRESGCCALEAPAIKREIGVRANAKKRLTAGRVKNEW